MPLLSEESFHDRQLGCNYHLRDGWRMAREAVKADWYGECVIITSPVMWFTYGQRNTAIREQRSVTTGCGGRALSKSNQPRAWGGLLTLSHGGIVYAATQEEWEPWGRD